MARSTLRVPFVDLKQPNCSLSLLKLINCDGGFRYGIPFTSSSVLVDYVDEVDSDKNSWCNCYAFTEIFATGNALLMDYIELGNTPDDKIQQSVLETLLSFLDKKQGTYYTPFSLQYIAGSIVY
jgi:hypothetical protein